MEFLQDGQSLQQKLRIIDSHKHLLSEEDYIFLTNLAHLICSHICADDFFGILKDNDIVWMPQKNSIAAILMISMIFDVPISEIKYMNSGAVKSAYKVNLGGKPHVIRIYDMAPIQQYFENFITKGLTESEIYKICYEHDPIKAPTLMAQNQPVGILPIDISEYTANLASILDHILSNPSLDAVSRERVATKLTQLLRMNRFSGLVRRDGSIYVVQFDFSHVVATASKKRLSYPEFKSWILQLFEASSTIEIEEASVGDSIP
jgi:hypothetical protein